MYGRELVYKNFVEGFATQEDLDRKLRVIHINLDSPCEIFHSGDRYAVIIGNVESFKCMNCGEVKGSVLNSVTAGNRIYIKQSNSHTNWKKRAEEKVIHGQKIREDIDNILKGVF